MKKLLFVLMLLFASCNPKIAHYPMVYKYQLDNRDFSKRFNKPFYYYVHESNVTGELKFEKYTHDFKFKTVHKFNIVKGKSYEFEITPGYYYMTLTTADYKLQDDGNAYYGSWYIEKSF